MGRLTHWSRKKAQLEQQAPPSQDTKIRSHQRHHLVDANKNDPPAQWQGQVVNSETETVSGNRV